MNNRILHAPVRRSLYASVRIGLATLVALSLSQCASKVVPSPKQATNIVVSVKEQKLALYSKKGTVAKTYPISTSKFGLSDRPSSYGTPLGLHEIVAKIGHGLPSGSVFKTRQPTGEIIKPNAPGRDPIVTRIMWLRGMEAQNKNAYSRCIYIHGTAEEINIGKPVSYGCIRMKSRDVMTLFGEVGIGYRVLIVQGGLPTTVPIMPTPRPSLPAKDAPPIFLGPQPNATSEPAILPNAPLEPVTLAQNTNITRKHLPDGSTVLYTASGETSPVMLKSRRSASSGIQP